MSMLSDLLNKIIVKINNVSGNYVQKAELATLETDPTVPEWAKAHNPPTYTAEQVGADPEGTGSKAASSAVASHNADNSAHSYILGLINALSVKVNNFLDVDESTSKQLSELLAAIAAAEESSDIDALSVLVNLKVNKTDIVNSLSDSSTDKPLSAAQGAVLNQKIMNIDFSPYAKTADVNSKLTGYVTTATLTALQNSLESRINTLEKNLNGFSFSDGTSAPTSGGSKHITFVDL